MKSMLVSLVFFTLSVLTVAVNTVYVTGFLRETQNILDSFPEAPPDAESLTHLRAGADSLCSKWYDGFILLSLSINTAELRDCLSAIESIAAYTGTSEPADYNNALLSARTKIRVLLQRERFSLLNIV